MNTLEKKVKLFNTKDEEEKVILIGVEDNKSLFRVEDSLNELEDLVNTAGATVLGQMIQKRESIHKSHYFGKGKIEELKNYIEEAGANAIVCDDDLTPSQIRNLTQILNIKVMTRTLVILDIFAQRARTSEGKIQVELAQLKYKLSHLIGYGKNMSRLGGGIGTRGPGEKKLELDKRNILNRISELSKEVKDIQKHRNLIRNNRTKNKVPIISLVGYTNSGKSTLMNSITKANVLAQDKLFATLDVTARKFKMNSGLDYLFIDTVGFIQKLPHNLIKAFKSTLEEIKYSDIIVNVVDVSSEIREEQMKVVYETLKELKCLDKPILTVFNKIDKEYKTPLPNDDICFKYLEISAKNNQGVETMLEVIESKIQSLKKYCCILIPYSKSSLIQNLYNKCEIILSENKEEGMYFEAYIDNEIENKLSEYII